MRTWPWLAVAAATGATGVWVAACQALPNTCEVAQTCAGPDAAAAESGATLAADAHSEPPPGPVLVAPPEGGAGSDSGDAGDAADGAALAVDAGADADAADAGDGSDGFVCPEGAEPKDEPCLIDEAFGVFVSTKGKANAPGTRAAPLRSIAAALTMARSRADGGAPKRVYVCGGSYDEALSIDASRDGAQIFGGFRCSDWTYTGERTALSPSTAPTALTLSSLTSALFVDLEFDALSTETSPPVTPSTSGASSVAVIAALSNGVEFRRVTVVASAGQPGSGGALTPFTFPATSDLLGNAASGASGGPAKTVVCPGGAGTTGGKGGDAPVSAGDPGLPSLSGGAGGSSIECVAGQGGFPGANAPQGADGAGAATLGTLAATGVWTPSAGVAGANGGPGQGGGGGGAVLPGGGGGGGAGACGGAGGGAGGGGGASVAVVAFGSALTFTDATLFTATAGTGGAGVAGQPGQSLGGNGGLPDPSGGCQGGRGGAGGGGGSGGGGAGGVSVGVLYKGTAPVLDAMTRARFNAGLAGVKGVGGAPGLNDGVSGTTALTLEAP